MFLLKSKKYIYNNVLSLGKTLSKVNNVLVSWITKKRANDKKRLVNFPFKKLWYFPLGMIIQIIKFI